MTITNDDAHGVADIKRLLCPRSVAIVGASSSAGSLGASVLGNLERNGFSGDIHLINPKRAEIHGRPCLPAVEQLPHAVDVAVLAIPQPAVNEAIRGLAARGVGAAIIFSAGFAEAGQEGLDRQREITAIASQHGMVIEGPNCLGCINYVDRVPLTFVEANLGAADEAAQARPSIGVVSQSGAMMAVLCTTLSSRQLPLSYAVSTGNEAASHAEDYVEFLLGDPDTRVIAMIAEQFRQPRRMLAAARRARAAGKFVVVLHPGKSSAARESAATHTGALAGDYPLMRAKLQRAGAIFAETLEELGDVSEIAVRCANLPTPGVAVVGESGAFKAMTLDLAEDAGLTLPELNAGNAPALRAAMPDLVAVSNPLDLTAQGLVDPDLYYRVLKVLLEDARFGSVVVGLIQGDPVTSGIKFPPLLRAVRESRSGKPVIVAGLDEGADVPAGFIAELREVGVPWFPSTERAFRAVQRLNAYAVRSFDVSAAPSTTLQLPSGHGVVAEYQAKDLLEKAGIEFAPRGLVRTAEEAVAAAEALGHPVALKAQSVQLSHKSDAGAVILNVAGGQGLKQAWERLHHNVRRHDPAIALDGVLIEAMAEPGLELIIGGRNDPEWGPVILVGMGGVVAEAIKDVRLLDADLPVGQILAELDRLKGAALLHGFRGAPELDLPAVAELVGCLGQVLRGTPAIREIDLNPVVVYPRGRGALPLDALMLIGTT